MSDFDQPQDLLFAMRKKYLDLILSGRKTIEVRRTHPAKCPDPFWEYLTDVGKKIFFYYAGKIWGEATIKYYNFDPVIDLEKYTDSHFSRACLSREEWAAYWAGAKGPCFYELKNIVAYDEPKKTDLRPQSWMYY